jgi:hypothetical protein
VEAVGAVGTTSYIIAAKRVSSKSQRRGRVTSKSASCVRVWERGSGWEAIAATPDASGNVRNVEKL